MALIIEKVKATKGDLWAAANDLSRGDLTEFHSLQSGRNPLEVIPKYLDETTHAIKCGSLVLAVGGHADGVIWFVTTDVVEMLSKGERFRFYRILKDHLGGIQREFPNVSRTNFVSDENHAHIRLLESLGARFSEAHYMSPAGFRFRQFWI